MRRKIAVSAELHLTKGHRNAIIKVSPVSDPYEEGGEHSWRALQHFSCPSQRVSLHTISASGWTGMRSKAH